MKVIAKIKLKIFIIASIISLLYNTSCNNPERNSMQQETVDFTESLPDNFNDLSNELIYILDASCSSCIADCAKFIIFKRETSLDIVCNIFIEDSYKDIFYFYMEKLEIGLGNDIRLKVLPIEYPFGFEEKKSNIFLKNSETDLIIPIYPL